MTCNTVASQIQLEVDGLHVTEVLDNARGFLNTVNRAYEHSIELSYL